MGAGYGSKNSSPHVNAVPAFHTEELSAGGSAVITWE